MNDTPWMESAQAHYENQAHEREEARKTTAKTPKTEAEALKLYRRARALKDAAALASLEQQAQTNGWNSLAEWRARMDEIQARNREIDRRIAARITTQEEAAAQAAKAWKAGDRALHQAIREMAQAQNWSLKMTPTPKNTTELAAQIHTEFTELLTSRDNAIAPYQADLKARRITADYVADKLAAGTTERQERLAAITESVSKHYADAEASYEQAYQALATPTGDTNEQLLAEMRASKAWERTQREMANVADTSLLSQLTSRVKDADSTTLRVLIEEMPSYLAGRGIPDASAVVRRAISQRPELADVNARITEAAKLRDVTTHNARHLAEVVSNITPDNTAPDARVAYVDPTSINY